LRLPPLLPEMISAVCTHGPPLAEPNELHNLSMLSHYTAQETKCQEL
jgi:hypothetical protein